MSRNTFLLIDAHALIYRAYYAFPNLTDSQGHLVNAVYGFTRMFLTALNHFEPEYTAVCFDHKKNPIIALTLRHDRLDNFWFSLMHELAHIDLHFDGGFDWFLDEKLDQANQDPKEEDADNRAKESLISLEQWSSAKFSSVNDVLNFAKELKIHPCIVIGRRRREEGDYTLFSKSLKIPKVRHFFMA